MNKFAELDRLPELGVGKAVTIDGTNPEQVREYIKSNKDIKAVGHRIVAVTDTIVTVVRTEGRKSAKKQTLLDAINNMHPFQRLYMPDYRIEYVRNILREIYEKDGRVFQCLLPDSDEIAPSVEIFTDPFNENNGQQFTVEDMARSFLQTMSDIHGEGQIDIFYQIERICKEIHEPTEDCAEDEETEVKVDTQA
ncbi:MAG: hypothetical protein ACI9JN_001257 [Bacteroidia bacterium]|jgi:hypothetical protein